MTSASSVRGPSGMRAALPVALLLLLSCGLVLADEIFYHISAVGTGSRITATAILQADDTIAAARVSDAGEYAELSSYRDGQATWSARLSGTGVDVFDIRYDRERLWAWAVGSWKSGDLLMTDTTGATTKLTPTVPAELNTTDTVFYFVAAVGLDGKSQALAMIVGGWDTAAQAMNPHTSMIVTADASIVLVGPYLDRAYSVGGSSASSNGFGSLVGVLRPSTDSGKAFVLYELVFPDHFNATDLFLTAAEPSSSPDTFYATGFATLKGTPKQTTLKLILDHVALTATVTWHFDISLDHVAQSHELSSLVSSSGSETVVAVGAFSGTASSPTAAFSCTLPPCVLVVALSADGSLVYGSAVAGVGVVDEGHPLFIASNGTNVMITGPATEKTSAGSLSFFDPSAAPKAFLVSFQDSGEPLYLNALFEGAADAAVFSMSTFQSYVHVGGSLEGASLDLPGIGATADFAQRGAFVALMSPYEYVGLPTAPVEELGDQWLAMQTVIVVSMFAAVALAGIGFMWIRNRRRSRATKRAGAKGGKKSKYTSVAADDDDDDVTVFAIGDDQL